MNRCSLFPALALIALIPLSTASAQFEITYGEMQTILVNSTRMNYQGTYGSPVSVNLGSPSASGQTFDFSALPAPDSVSAISQEFMDPAGQPGAASFPNATLCTPFVDTTSFPGGEMTFVQYYRLQADGFYLVGQYIHMYYPLVMDEEYVEAYSPMRLLLPLPLAYGTNRTGIDTVVVDSTTNDYEVRTTNILVDGWGDITLPDLTAPAGSPKTMVSPCLRGTETEIVDTYSAGTFSQRDKYVSVVYITEEGALLIAEQTDSSFAGGTASVSDISLSMRTGGATDVRQTSPALPEGYSISQNYPNPFNPSTTIAFSIPEAGLVRLAVYDVLGREVATLVERQMAPGSYEATFDAASLPSGLYIYRIVSGSFVETRKMNVVK